VTELTISAETDDYVIYRERPVLVLMPLIALLQPGLMLV
jgi:hypothetical protein